MVDVTESFVPGRELVALGRRGVPAAMAEPSGPVRRGEADGRWGPAPPGCAGRGAAQTGQIAQPDTRERGINHLVGRRGEGRAGRGGQAPGVRGAAEEGETNATSGRARPASSVWWNSSGAKEPNQATRMNGNVWTALL